MTDPTAAQPPTEPEVPSQMEDSGDVGDSAVPEQVESVTQEPQAAGVEAPTEVDVVDEAPVAAEAGALPEEPAVPAVPEEPAVPTPAQVAAVVAPSAPVPAPVPAPSPAMFARRHGPPDQSAYGRVDEDGQVYVKTADGERAVGSYPGASRGEALAYFARKYDELVASAELLHQRVQRTDVPVKDADEALAKLREQTTEPNVVGDLSALDAKVEQIATDLGVRRSQETEQRKAAREEGRVKREALVAEAEQIAAQPEQSIQWKTSGARMRELLDEWKKQQRSGPRLERSMETALWQRFSAARNSFDRLRRVHFAQLDSQQGAAKTSKEKLVVEAERLATSKDWASTAGAFKSLMDQWRQAGRAGRADDDALWERFKAAQDSFFEAKDALVAKEEEGFRANLEVKERLMHEAEAILPVTDLAKAKTALRGIQERWDKAGKVPRADMERTEKVMRRVEQAVRDAEDKRWASSNPEAAARARSLVEQLETAVAGLRNDLAKAQAAGNPRKVADAQAALEAREQWLAQAHAGVEEFGA